MFLMDNVHAGDILTWGLFHLYTPENYIEPAILLCTNVDLFYGNKQLYILKKWIGLLSRVAHAYLWLALNLLRCDNFNKDNKNIVI